MHVNKQLHFSIKNFPEKVKMLQLQLLQKIIWEKNDFKIYAYYNNMILIIYNYTNA